MNTFAYILLSTIGLSLISLSGVILLTFTKNYTRYLIPLVSLSAGTLLGGAFLHLLPEALESTTPGTALSLVLAAFVLFFIIEKTLHWHHCHDGECTTHTEGHMSLIGDAFHNILDGMIIAAAYATDISLGIVTTLAVGLHEIPQEISDLGVLLHYGFKKNTALLYNFLIATFSIAGGIIGYLWTTQAQNIATTALLPFAAGGFIYIATTDLMPEIKKETNLAKSLTSLLCFILGIALMWILTLSEI